MPITSTTARFSAPFSALLVLLTAAIGLTPLPASAKDVDPTSPRCDALARDSAAWRACATGSLEQETTAAADGEAFYAGYWLARTGHYAEALEILRQARPTTRVLTYIGFATRKLGHVDEALPIYRSALALDPDNTVARAYLGEAHLARRDLAAAEAELAEIATRCGRSCAEYADLEGHIADYRAGRFSTEG